MSDLLQNIPNIVRLTLEDLGNDAKPIEKYIEQLQQRNSELEEENGTLRSSSNAYNSIISHLEENPLFKKVQQKCWKDQCFSGAVIVNYVHELHEDSRLVVNKMKQLERERDELAAHVERCVELLNDIMNSGRVLPGGKLHHRAYDAVRRNPQTSLAEVKSKAVEDALEEFWPDDMKGTELWIVLKQHAQQVRNGKDGERCLSETM